MNINTQFMHTTERELRLQYLFDIIAGTVPGADPEDHCELLDLYALVIDEHTRCPGCTGRIDRHGKDIVAGVLPQAVKRCPVVVGKLALHFAQILADKPPDAEDALYSAIVGLMKVSISPAVDAHDQRQQHEVVYLDFVGGAATARAPARPSDDDDLDPDDHLGPDDRLGPGDHRSVSPIDKPAVGSRWRRLATTVSAAASFLVVLAGAATWTSRPTASMGIAPLLDQHAAKLGATLRPFVDYVENGSFEPRWSEVVDSTVTGENVDHAHIEWIEHEAVTTSDHQPADETPPRRVVARKRRPQAPAPAATHDQGNIPQGNIPSGTEWRNPALAGGANSTSGSGLTYGIRAPARSSESVEPTAPDHAAREPRPGEGLIDSCSGPVDSDTLIMSLPGFDVVSWGWPRLETPAARTCRYTIKGGWGDAEVEMLMTDLDDWLGHYDVILAGYSMSGPLAVEILDRWGDRPGADPDRVQLLMIAPAARVRGVPRSFVPKKAGRWARAWEQHWIGGLLERARSEPAWGRLVKERTYMVLAADDDVVDYEAYGMRTMQLLDKHVIFAPTRSHTKLRRSDKLTDTIRLALEHPAL